MYFPNCTLYLIVKIIKIIYSLINLYHSITFQFLSGERCQVVTSNESGICVRIDNCTFAVEQLRQNIHPTTCSFEGKYPIVCCPKLQMSTKEPAVGRKSEESMHIGKLL